MINTEKLMLTLLIGICLLISIVLIDTIVDPAMLISTVFASGDDVYQPTDNTDNADTDNAVNDDIDLGTSFSPEEMEEILPILQEGWEIYRDEGFAFEIQYPKTVVQKSLLNQDALNAGVGVGSKAPVWEFTLEDPSFYQGTNLIKASLIIHVLEGEDQVKKCSDFKPGSIYQTPNLLQDSLPEVKINENTFLKDEVLEGGMGEFYRRISYKLAAKGACYEITQLINYQNIDGFIGTELTEFDEKQVIADLDKVVETFTILEVEPTFPAKSYPIPKTISTAIAKSATIYVDGLDVSHWQGTINWNQVANAGYIFTFAKGTEGVGWTDVKFHENMVNGRDAGVLMGVYHFARPDIGNSGADEANYFLSAAGDYLEAGYLRPVLDLEVGGSLGKTALSNWVIEWMETVKSRTGIEPLIYTNLSFIDSYMTEAVTEYDLWIAYWNCNPVPTFTIPPTGKWRDWAFWQWYGPGGCGPNPGFVPGIETNIDLNIFNGVEAGLQAYAASSDLWVSLVSDAYYVPTPYFADIVGNVNGDDTTGPFDYSFWWDCPALEADVSLVEGVCGTLPTPTAGECQKDDIGMKCVAVENDIQIAEHTFWESGNYTAKVIVERGTDAPVEDRYKISTYNPIRDISHNPSSPGNANIDESFELNTSVLIDTTVSGSLQVSIVDPGSREVIDSDCLTVPGDQKTTGDFTLSWMESSPGEMVYEAWTRYRAWSGCPIDDEHPDDLLEVYQVNWQALNPVLELESQAGALIPSGSNDDLADQLINQTIELVYVAKNPTTTNSFEITAGTIENLNNVLNAQVSPTEIIVVGPGEEQIVNISFEVENPGPFSFYVVLEHDASNPSPYTFTVQGSGVTEPNPIQSVSTLPVSPGQQLFGSPFVLLIEVEIDAPSEGAMQVSLEDDAGNPVQDPVCTVITETGPGQFGFDFEWTESEMGSSDYTIWARYRSGGVCPIDDSQDEDITEIYQVNWEEDSSVLELQQTDGTPIPTNSIDDLGDREPYQIFDLEYIVFNSSTNKSLEIQAGTIENLVNVLNTQLTPSAGIVVGPGEEQSFTLTFEIENTGPFSFDVNLEHDASNPSPYTFAAEGTGVMSANPIQSVSPVPVSPGESLIGESFSTQITVELDAPISGALQVGLEDQDGGEIQDPVCLTIDDAGLSQHNYGFSWVETAVGNQDLLIQTLYSARVGCPISDSADAGDSQVYQVNWVEDSPILELQHTGGEYIPSGGIVENGQLEYLQTIELEYLVHNKSTTTSLGISDLRFENLVNLTEVNTTFSEPLDLGPGETQSVQLSFQIEKTGSFSFDLVLDHNASNGSPYLVTLQGIGIISDNPIKFISPNPASPGSTLIGNTYQLAVDIGIAVPDQGSLQVNLVEVATGDVQDQGCKLLDEDLNHARTFNFSWARTDPGSVEYTIWARYQAQGECPIEDSFDSDLSQNYYVNWEEESPFLELKTQEGTDIPAGSSHDVGQNEFYQMVEQHYIVLNTSKTTGMQINSVSVENLINLNQVTLSSSGPITLEPEGQVTFSTTYLVTETESYSFDLVLEHSGSNSSPYLVKVQGIGVLTENPIQSISMDPVSPGNAYISEPFQLKISTQVDPPAQGVLEVSLVDQGSSIELNQVCVSLLDVGIINNDFEFSWTESEPADSEYTIHARYQAEGNCPISGVPDAELTESYSISWQEHKPILEVKRPEGVSIFDGAVDYVGVHDFYRLVEVTYVIENDPNNGPMTIEEIFAENLINLNSVTVEPSDSIVVGPGESQIIKVTFQVLMLEPYSFDLVWLHDASNGSPYMFTIQGDANLNLGDYSISPRWYDFIVRVINSGIFLRYPHLVLWFTRGF